MKFTQKVLNEFNRSKSNEGKFQIFTQSKKVKKRKTEEPCRTSKRADFENKKLKKLLDMKKNNSLLFENRKKKFLLTKKFYRKKKR